ncbi:type I restriction-modification system subunit M N-terminal domain-containing protein [Phocaeicola vulgatus]|uniref:HsdM N-terminal domain protein n=1 Tax=Phocaeicola vulgatus str. 3775 SL(B) 10 (iv) TaxID=1339350 RepID=A0A078RAN8_PHOVU|nr:type I restriction-modification system subunit M N-terminal domain-containing protein [Phocaeicola vulgatus]KDS30249.1 hsdM N-terminal domain protein [Phocaeicola vulgatus str. 3775 SR(B) 19]KDS31032.1 hsdM N-terminal domain protein [Phocaeicola vulgatus str. 3775 SL(B) 10 (iv)]
MNKQQLANKIWASANKMRSKIDANEYKDYKGGETMRVKVRSV